MHKIRLRSPIQSILQSNKGKDEFAKGGLKYLPYRGSGDAHSDNYLKLLYDLSELSPSQKTCINAISKYAFQSIDGFAIDYIPGLTTDFSDIDETLKTDIAKKLIEIGIHPVKIVEISKCIATHIKICGNAYLHYYSRKLNGVTTVTLNVLHPMKCRIKADDKLYNTLYVKNRNQNESEAKEYRIFPAMVNTRSSKECVFHIKNDDGSNPNYGSPDSLQTLRNQYIEYALTELSATVSGRSEVASKIFAVSVPIGAGDGGDDDPLQMVNEMGRGLRKLTTLEGDDSKTLAVIAKPEGETMESFDLAVNRDTAWYKEQIDKHSSAIYAAHDYNKQLSGFGDAQAGLGGNVIDSLLIQYGVTVSEWQNKISDAMMDVTNLAFEHSGDTEYIGTKIIFHNTIDKIVDRIRSTSTNNQNTVGE